MAYRPADGRLRTLSFIAIVFIKQAALYTNREHGRLWASRPSGWVLASSLADVAIGSALAIGGIAMSALPPLVVVGAGVAAAAFAFVLDAIKVPAFGCLGIR